LSDTDDLVQDTFIKTLRRVGEFEPEHEGSFQAYLRQALANRIRDELKRVSRSPKTEVLETEPGCDARSPLESLLGAETVGRYETALGTLRAEDRDKPSANAARVAVSRAVLRLAQEMARAR
jgi:RNA polymerase sigma-70 factor (ECF subfamily)